MSYEETRKPMSTNSFGVVAVVPGRQGGWPGQSTWNDPTQCYIVSPVIVDYGVPFGIVEYSFSESFALPSNPSGAPVYVTLFDPHRTGFAAIFVELSNTKFNDPTYVRLGVIVGGTAVGDWTNPTFGASGASHSSGLVPDPGSTPGTTHFLREDATWAVPSGGGGGAVTSVFTRTGAVVATSGDYSVGQVTGAAPLASPALTGVPTAPTASPGTNTTQLATTAFVLANGGASPIQQAIVVISSAQILALSATPVTLVPSPGAGKALALISITLQFKPATTPYTVPSGHQFNVIPTPSGIPNVFQGFASAFLPATGFIDQADNEYINAIPGQYQASHDEIENQALGLVLNGPVTGGDGSLIATVNYTVIVTQ